jgi:hypothetical protein
VRKARIELPQGLASTYQWMVEHWDRISQD